MTVSAATWKRLGELSGTDRTVSVEGSPFRIRKDWIRFLPVFSRLDDEGSGIVALDGPSASGKSTLAGLLHSVYGCPVIPMDDFFLPRERASKTRLGEIGGNLDRERFLEEVVSPLLSGQGIRYRVFDCSTQDFSGIRKIPSSPLLVVEGVYSLHPQFRALYSLSVFLEVKPLVKWIRIFRRNKGRIGLSFRHLRKWLPLENRYFRSLNLAKTADLRIR